MKYKFRKLQSTGEKKSNEKAFLQFIWDHATPVVKGWHCQFFFRNEADLRGRVQARKYGLLRLKDLDKEWLEVQAKYEEYVELKKVYSATGWRKKIIDFILKL